MENLVGQQWGLQHFNTIALILLLCQSLSKISKLRLILLTLTVSLDAAMDLIDNQIHQLDFLIF